MSGALQRGFAILLIIVSGPVAWGQTVWTVGGDFSATTNPNGAWRYGSATSVGGTFTAFSQMSVVHGGLDAWSSGTVNGLGHDLPSIVHNGTGASFNTFTTIGVVPVNGTILHPGLSGILSVARWTVPAPGSYLIAAGFSNSDSVGTTTTAFVARNGVALGSGAVGLAGSFNYSSSLLGLSAGETIDFMVNWGSNGNYFSDSTRLAATITAVPEAPVWVTLLVGLALVSRQRRRSLRAS